MPTLILMKVDIDCMEMYTNEACKTTLAHMCTIWLVEFVFHITTSFPTEQVLNCQYFTVAPDIQ